MTEHRLKEFLAYAMMIGIGLLAGLVWASAMAGFSPPQCLYLLDAGFF